MAQTFTISKLNGLLKVDRRTLKKLLATVPPDGEGSHGPEWTLDTVQNALRVKNERNAGASTLKEQKLAEEVRRLKIYNDKQEGNLVPLDRIIAVNIRLASALNAEMQRAENEGPALLAGLSVAEVRTGLKRYHDGMRREIQRFRDEFLKERDGQVGPTS